MQNTSSKKSKKNVYFLLFLVLLVFGMYIPIYSISNNSREDQLGCNVTSLLRTLENYGKINIIYVTTGFSDRVSTWSIRFTSNTSTGYDFVTKSSSADICVALNNVYDKAMDIPMISK